MKETIENLKCCGNCLYRISFDMEDYYQENCHKHKPCESSRICVKWAFDEMTNIDRLEGE